MKTKLIQIISITFFLSAAFSIKGQTIHSDTSKVENKYPTFMQYRIHYPDSAKQKKIEGTIIITYDIDSNCSIINRRVGKKLGYGCEEEALKVLDQYEVELKKLNKSTCHPEKELQFPVKFSIPK